jgi:hypothetical protein
MEQPRTTQKMEKNGEGEFGTHRKLLPKSDTIKDSFFDVTRANCIEKVFSHGTQRHTLKKDNHSFDKKYRRKLHG